MTNNRLYDAIPEYIMRRIRIMSKCDVVKDIPGYPLYAITLTGDVYSVHITNSQRVASIPRLLKPAVGKGYKLISLKAENGEIHHLSPAKIMLLTFVSPPPTEDAIAMYKDGDFHNHSLSNIKWGTPGERQINTAKRWRQT